MFHPEVATRDCEHCLKYIYNDKTGILETDKRGDPIERPKHPNTLAPCRRPLKKQNTPCPKGTPENQKKLSPRNLRVLNYYKECKAVGSFPDDGLFRQLSAVIYSIEEQYKEYSEFKRTEIIANSVIAAAGGSIK